MTNVKLTYDYTLNSIKIVDEGISKINTKLGVVLTLSGILINFGKDLPDHSFLISSVIYDYPCLSCYILKISAYLLLIAAIILSLWGLIPPTVGKIILPQQLLADEWNLCSEDEYLMDIIKYLEQETLLKLSEIRTKKAKRLEKAIFCLAMAVILLGVDQILAMSLSLF